MDHAPHSSSPHAVPPELPPVAPDATEQELGNAMDNIVPTHGYHLDPIVGIGGSAGAIPSLQTFFENVPDKSGLAFVVILHLSPDHASLMPELIQQWTTLHVTQASDSQKVKPNRVYVIPPGKQLSVSNGHLWLADLAREHGRRMAVDLFFRSLADAHGPHATAVVLSGADGDGTLGVKRIKERGGLTIAQDPTEAEHDSMPRAAIDTGMVDWVLKAADMPRRILDYVARERRLLLPAEEEAPSAAGAPASAADLEKGLSEIINFVRTRTGRDFSYYKRATILRRLSRRMQVNALEDLRGYLGFLRTHPGEAGALLKELLISVTNFFRDRDAFAVLAERIPELFEGKTRSDTVRAWIAACATGEEAYSIAMLLVEHARTLEAPPGIQVFACDLDEDAVQNARAGFYPDAITADVSEERLRRFFVKETRGYRVRREVRELVLFTVHDLLKDPPFSRLDLVSCRNLLIYLERKAQERIFETFHFALKSTGLLFLGSAESAGDGNQLFRTIDKKHSIYARRSTGVATPAAKPEPVPFFTPHIPAEEISEHARTAGRPVILPAGNVENSGTSRAAPGPDSPTKHGHPERSDLHLKLIERLAPPSILIDSDYEIQHLSEKAASFLQVAGGRPTANLLRLINPALRIELRGTLYHAAQSGQIAESRRVHADINGQKSALTLQVAPAGVLAPGFLLVTFHVGDSGDAAEKGPPVVQSTPAVEQLERELEEVKARLRDTVEQHAVNTEELRASNEEFQSMNEELRSATEELETNREELQSINEELVTVNQELKEKVDELAHSNSDLQNFMGATAIATVFLDREMRVMRFTDSASPIFNLIKGDIGRPLSDLQHEIDYPEIAADAATVLEKLTPIERQVTGAADNYYLARMLPYRTVEDKIAGVVLTFVDITERHRAQHALRENLDELTRFNTVAVGRESRMIELKKEVNELCARFGEPRRYPLAFETERPD
jgi:two-component system CheB/CheR fusion protein